MRAVGWFAPDGTAKSSSHNRIFLGQKYYGVQQVIVRKGLGQQTDVCCQPTTVPKSCEGSVSINSPSILRFVRLWLSMFLDSNAETGGVVWATGAIPILWLGPGA